MRTCWYGEAAHRWPASWHVDGAPKSSDVPVVVQRRGAALELRARLRSTLGRRPLRRIGAVTTRTGREVEGMPTRRTTRPQRLERFAFQPAPVYGICRPLRWRAAVPFRVAHASGEEIIAGHDDGVDGPSDRLRHGALARTTASINGHDQAMGAARAGTYRGDHGVDGRARHGLCAVAR